MSKQPTAITVALIRDPQGASWQAQIQVEYKGYRGADSVSLNGGADPLQLIHNCINTLDRRFNGTNGKIISQ